MKITINNIYDDGKTIFAQNPFLTTDARLADILAIANDLDLITELSFGARELLNRNIKKDDEHVFIYDMSKINRHVYAVLIENLNKYSALMATDEIIKETSPEYSYKEEITHGENVQTRAYGQKQNTNLYGAHEQTQAHGAITTTNTFGDVDTTHNVGATSQTTQNGARENTTSISAFSTNTFNPTDKTASAQSSDTVNFGAQSNTEKIQHGNDTTSQNAHTDTITSGTHTDTATQGAHTDTITNDETVDTKQGVRDLIDNVTKYRHYFDKSVLLTIATDCVNAISYSMYL